MLRPPRALSSSLLHHHHAKHKHRLLSTTSHPNSIPAYFIRGGTSKGIFINQAHLPRDRAEWDQIFRGIMGSPDEKYGRQLNGMGGGASSLSKVVVVKKGDGEGDGRGVDLEYTFVQVGIKDGVIDYSGNCGNLSAAVAPFALASGILPPSPSPNSSSTTTTILNTNTSKLIRCTHPTCPSTGLPDLARPEYEMPGVPGRASMISLAYLNPGGARTGMLFPTSNKVDVIEVGEGDGGKVEVTCIDCTNPTVLVRAEEVLPPNVGLERAELDALPDVLGKLERIRREGARLMGLDPGAQAQPKIAMVSSSSHNCKGGANVPSNQNQADVTVRALSMQQPHRAVPMTLAMALAAAVRVPGTIVDTKGDGDGVVRIAHPGGVVDVGVDVERGEGEGGVVVQSVSVFRTARVLMFGEVLW